MEFTKFRTTRRHNRFQEFDHRSHDDRIIPTFRRQFTLTFLRIFFLTCADRSRVTGILKARGGVMLQHNIAVSIQTKHIPECCHGLWRNRQVRNHINDSSFPCFQSMMQGEIQRSQRFTASGRNRQSVNPCLSAPSLTALFRNLLTDFIDFGCRIEWFHAFVKTANQFRPIRLDRMILLFRLKISRICSIGINQTRINVFN